MKPSVGDRQQSYSGAGWQNICCPTSLCWPTVNCRFSVTPDGIGDRRCWRIRDFGGVRLRTKTLYSFGFTFWVVHEAQQPERVYKSHGDDQNRLSFMTQNGSAKLGGTKTAMPSCRRQEGSPFQAPTKPTNPNTQPPEPKGTTPAISTTCKLS